MPVWAPTDLNQVRTAKGSFPLAQSAGTYDILTANGGDVWVEVEQAFVKTAASGLVSASVKANHSGGDKTIVATTLLAALLGDAILSIVSSKFLLPAGKKIQGTIVGTGSGGEIVLIVKWAPATPGAVLA